MASTTTRRQNLREFLISRRARVSPADVGLPGTGHRRRTPGLRREEVAVISGVGVSWYQWLEQGRDITVSPQVLDAVSRTLLLNDVERRHLYLLAGLNPPLVRLDSPAIPVPHALQTLIESWMPKPANITDRYWDNIAFNDAAKIVFDFDEKQRNCLKGVFLNPTYRERMNNWDDLAARVTAEYRASAAQYPNDPGFDELARELAQQSSEFSTLWTAQNVQDSSNRVKWVEHPAVGILVLESTQLQMPERPDLTLVLHTPVAGTGTEAKLERLVGQRTGQTVGGGDWQASVVVAAKVE